MELVLVAAGRVPVSGLQWEQRVRHLLVGGFVAVVIAVAVGVAAGVVHFVIQVRR